MISSYLNRKNILITGGSGSIGKSLAKQAISDGAKLVRLFSNDENGLYEIESEFTNLKKLEFVFGDIRDETSVSDVVKNIDVIYHAAALKHVDRCELYPFEAITTNILGTKNIIKSSLNESVDKFVFISTDKAVNPIGVMGATKLLGEKLLSAEAFHKKSKTIFSSVRFGNVFHTRGSILPRIERQIKNGGPLTLTDNRMRRFFMTKEQAVQLIINATKIAKGGETFVLKMPLLRLEDLFESMKEVLASRYGYKPNMIKTKIIGIRPGEKLTEYLLTDFEMENVLETKKFFIIPPLNQFTKPASYYDAKKPKKIKRYFEEFPPLSREKITKIIKELYS